MQEVSGARAIAVDVPDEMRAAERRLMDDAPLAVVRVVLDSPSHELFRLQALGGALKAAQSLRRASGVALQDWDPEG